MSGRHGPCGNECGEEISGRHSIPVGVRSCEVVANDFFGEWSPMAVCERCYKVHERAGPAGLEAYLEATADLRRDLSTARAHLQMIRGKADDALGEIGEGWRK
jgi:hypothetical protein